MRITEPKKVVALLNRMKNVPSHDVFFGIQRNRFEHARAALSMATIDAETINLACAEIMEHSGVSLADFQLRELLSLFPFVRIELSQGGVDTVTVELLMNMIANVFVGSDWPTFGDELSADELATFKDGVKRQAILHGYAVVAEEKSEVPA